MDPINTVRDLLLLAARQRFDPTDSRVVALITAADLDWGRLYRMAEAARVAPLVYHNLMRCPEAQRAVPDEVRGQFQWSRKWNAAVKTARAAKVAEVACFLDRCGVRVMLLKGAALDEIVYEEPWFVASDDVDLLADRAFEDLSPEEAEGLHRILPPSPIVELEYRRHHDLDLNGVLDLDYERLWLDARPRTFRGQPVWVMSAEDLLLTACVNLCRKRFSRLKELCAVAETLEAFGAMDWGVLARNARRAGADRIVATSLSVVESYLGCPVPEDAFAALSVGPLRGALIRRASTTLKRFLLPEDPAAPQPSRQRAAAWVLRLLSSHGRQFGRGVRVLYRLLRTPRTEPPPAPVAADLKARSST